MISNKNKIYGFSLIGLPVLLLLLVSGCCSPNVENSMLSPEAKNIQAWKIELAEDSTTVADTLMANIRADIKSKYTKKEYCEPYLNSIGDRLRARGYHIVEGSVTEGTIRIDIEGYKEHFRMVRVGHDNDWKEELEWDSRGDPTEGHLSGDEILVDAAKVLQTDEVKGVQIDFFDLGGKSIGQASISGCKVKPKFIAEVIHRMIIKGNY
jgi:hypothetical protein